MAVLDQALDALSINTIRTLSMDAVQKANSGHPGLPMGAAPMAYVLWTRFLKHNPTDPGWPDRDRFVLSAGHGSMLLYSLLYLTGYDLPLEELKRFRQLNSRTPGHPEHNLTPGVETTTGPLGQGFATGVGMAIAERFLAATFNRPGHEVVNHYTYALCSDGDLMEGISYEAASLAGTLKLGKLIYIYDDNHITIEGTTTGVFEEDVSRRFEAAGWHVQAVDGNDLVLVEAAVRAAQAETERPSLVRARTIIAEGSPNKRNTAAAHGSPLGVEEVRLTKENLGWPTQPDFYVPDEALRHFREAVGRGRAAQAEWQQRFEAYRAAFPDLAAQLELALRGELPAGWQEVLPSFAAEAGAVATRSASGKVLNALAPTLPFLVGGSADLAPSTDTNLEKFGTFSADNPTGRTFRFGIREHAMGAALNGMALHGGVRPYGATFLVFSDYCRPAIRIAALSEARSIYIFTHDSIGLGEDGPTHQPVEHLTALRAMPNLVVIRPADATETAGAWAAALQEQHGPVALVLTREKIPTLAQSTRQAIENVARGAYILAEADGGTPDVAIISTGSQVHLALEAREMLARQGVRARVVSMPSWELFDRQPPEYQESVIPRDGSVPRLAVEAGVTWGWYRYGGLDGDVLGLDRFGVSAPGEQALAALGLTAEAVAERALQLTRQGSGATGRVTPDQTNVTAP
ncbi:MAG: transketolase [Chloroflexi bacterium]|nr:transketolase [Chloroflexota bacterium]